MTFSRTLKPVFYPDAVNHMKLNGRAKSDILTDRTGSYNSGFDKFDLFDLNPQNLTSFDTSGNTTTHILIQIDLGTSAPDVDYVALLNHNLVSAEGTIRVAHSASTMSTAGAGTTIVSGTATLNGSWVPDSGETINEAVDNSETDIDVSDGTKFTVGEIIRVSGGSGNENMLIGSIVSNTLTVTRAQQGSSATTFEVGDNIFRYNCVTPAADGDTLIDFTASSDRYWALEIIPSDGVFSATDLTIGAMMIGEQHTLSLSPDINVGHSFEMNGVNISTGISGKRHSSPNWIKASNTTWTTGNYIPFRLDVGTSQIPGREVYSFSYSFIDDTGFFPSDLGSPSGDNFIFDVMSRTAWQAVPLIMSVDSTSTTQGDYIFCRFRADSFNLTQVASSVYSTSFSVDQEF